MNDGILISGLDVIEGKLLQHAAELDYVVLDEVVHRQKRLPVARVRFAPIDLIPFLDDQDDDDLDEGLEDAEDGEEDISDQPTEESTRSAAEEETVSAGRSALAATLEDDQEEEDPQREHQRRMCRAVVLWARGEVDRIMRNRPLCTFRLRLYKPKGGYVESKNFKAENPAYRPSPPEEPAREAPTASPSPATPASPIPAGQSLQSAMTRSEPAAPPPSPVEPLLPVPVQPQLPVVIQPAPVQVLIPAPPAPPPPAPRNTPAVAIALGGDGHGQLIYLDPDTIPESRVWRALGRATEEFLGTVGKTYTGIIDLQARTVTHQAEQLDKSHALVENLASQLLAARQIQATDEAEQKVDERQIRVREELGKTFLSELGSLGRVLASSRLGVPPELAELGDLVASSPELADAIRDPQVRAMLKDDKTRKELAQILRLAAARTQDGGGTPPQAA